MTTRRPAIGNTVAIDRFNPNGPAGYAAVYHDGTHGPTRSTREEAERDYHIPPIETLQTMKDPAHAVRQSPEAQALINAAADDDPGEERESMELDTHTDHEKHLYAALRIDRAILEKMSNEGLQADIAQAALMMSHAQQEQVRPYAGEVNGTDRYAIEGIAIYENFTCAQVQYIQAQQELVRRYRDQ